MSEKIQGLLQARIEAFANDITAILTDAVADAVGDALKSERGGRRGKAAKGRGRAAAGGRGRRKKGEKRPPEELKKLTDALLREVKKEGGRRIEQIGVAMGMPTRELVLPMKKLIADKSVKAKGQRRATTYTAG